MMMTTATALSRQQTRSHYASDEREPSYFIYTLGEDERRFISVEPKQQRNFNTHIFGGDLCDFSNNKVGTLVRCVRSTV